VQRSMKTLLERKKEFDDVESALDRSEADIEKHGASMLQTNNAHTVTEALNVLVKATSFSTDDASKLKALLQSSQESDDSDADMELGAPAAAAYEEHGGGTMGVLEKLEDNAKSMEARLVKKEEKATYDFGLLESSLKQDIFLAEREMKEQKERLAEDSETKATAEGDLSVTSKDLENDIKALEELHTECMTKANDFESVTKDRAEELKALATAKKIIIEATSGAQKVSYGLDQVSFVQLRTSTRLSTHLDLVGFEVVQRVRDLARKQNSPVMSQLASRMSSAVKLGTSESDVFAKIKGLVSDMIAKLEDEAEKDATEAAYCEKETTETTEKKTTNEEEISKLTTKIDQSVARSAKLKQEVATLQEELAELAKSQAEMGKLRSEEKAIFVKTEADLKMGIGGVQKALKVLNDYYSKSGKSGGASSGIISMLEVAESDMSKDLSELTTIEKTAVQDFEAQTKENEMTKTMKAQDEKYKTKEFTSLDDAVSSLSSDLDGVKTEQDAVLEYLAKINERCIAKVPSYSEIKARREAEIAGLKDALETLETETAFIQKSSTHTLRGLHKHSAA